MTFFLFLDNFLLDDRYVSGKSKTHSIDAVSFKWIKKEGTFILNRFFK